MLTRIAKKVTEIRESGSRQEAVAKRADLIPSNRYGAAAYTHAMMTFVKSRKVLLGHNVLVLLPALLEMTAKIMHLDLSLCGVM